MLTRFIKRYERWYSYYQFNRLSETDKKVFRFLELDPDSLIKHDIL
jgi:hypothetical protein